MQAAVAAGIPHRVLVTTGYGEAVGRAIDAEGMSLPTTILPARGSLAGIPPEITPVLVHRDLASAVELM
eukprot:scaffold648454_cov55-Prasinocladus_malaysianus.AAC.1